MLRFFRKKLEKSKKKIRKSVMKDRLIRMLGQKEKHRRERRMNHVEGNESKEAQ